MTTSAAQPVPSAEHIGIEDLPAREWEEAATPAEAVEVVPEAPPTKKQELIFVTTEERLTIENLHLRAINCSQRIVQHQLQMQQALTAGQTAVAQEQEALEGWQEKIAALGQELGQKYNVDLTRFMVRETDGAIIPRPQQ